MSSNTEYTDEHGQTWQTYLVDFESDGAIYSVQMMARSFYHASLMVSDLKDTAHLVGRLELEVEV